MAWILLVLVVAALAGGVWRWLRAPRKPTLDRASRANVRSVAFDFGRATSDQVCPYCSFAFDAPPTRRRKCPKCKQSICRATLMDGRRALLTEEEGARFYAALSAEFAAQMRERNRQTFNRARAQALGIGSPGYIWRTSRDGDVCPACTANEGRRFDWDRPPAHGHAGICDACTEGYCRCWAEAIVPDL